MRVAASHPPKAAVRGYNALMLKPVLRSAWVFPTTAVGLAIGCACVPLKARWRMHSGVIEIHSGGVAWLLKHAVPLPGGAMAMTLGGVVLGVNETALEITREHERVHVRQARRWGPFFIPAYFTASGIAWLRRRDAYHGNPFEREAYACSGPRRR